MSKSRFLRVAALAKRARLDLPATPEDLDALLWDAYADGRADEVEAMAEQCRELAGEEYAREQMASANSGSEQLNGGRG